MINSINLGPAVGSALAILLGLIALRSAWLALHLKRAIVSPMDRIAMWLLKAIGRSDAAARLESKVRSPRYVAEAGWLNALAGMALVVGGAIMAVGFIAGLLKMTHGGP